MTSDTMCAGEDLPVNPFLSLRTAFGMLLGVDDFDVLMGNPRGKGMLHNARLHGCGVVCGYDVGLDADGKLRVGPGLAIDGIGRELCLDRAWCLDLDAWVDEQRMTDGWDTAVRESTDGSRWVCACLVARFTTCVTKPLPVLLDPCDPSRSGYESSRQLETTALSLRLAACEPCGRPGFDRLRRFIGPDVGGGAARYGGACDVDAPFDDRVAAVNALAAGDVVDLCPDPGGDESGGCCFPDEEADGELALAEVCLKVRRANGKYEICDVAFDRSVGRFLLPTWAIQQLLIDLAVRLDDMRLPDAGGPRVVADSVVRAGSRIEFRVTRPLFEPSLRDNVVVSSLTGSGWVDEPYLAQYSDGTLTVVIELQQPRNSLVWRAFLRGTGPSPIVSDTFIPLAGLDCDPPCMMEGRDAVLTSAASSAP